MLQINPAGPAKGEEEEVRAHDFMGFLYLFCLTTVPWDPRQYIEGATLLSLLEEDVLGAPWLLRNQCIPSILCTCLRKWGYATRPV